ncbi:citryl-CoA lyase [Paractinoplanes atraurantiacus]|uniref:citrate synthase (unknown stereospecificity) n=1 Tax=Paractinoplanes atraurantiacus TaxID=1036182 RepID=A0A285K8T6_9ACTN|nr:citryl-CoA lyase [Actinoplanes atraurantiacus]SNY68653.1 citrate synthase [Actinoplanes atraurantiacus]
MTDSQAADWWATAVSRIEPNVIELRGIPVADLIGDIGFGEMTWLMLRGSRPTPDQLRLFEAALIAGVDHGPHAPSIAVARMAATCGVGLNNAMASAINVLGDSHGGAGEQCVALLSEIVTRDVPAEVVVAEWRARGIRYLPGFGHRFHTRDPRRDPLIDLTSAAAGTGVVTGDHLRAALAVEEALHPVPMNIDGATAVIYAELGFPAPLARGLFVLSRSVGILAHAWEETGQGRRNKGPIPPSIRPTYLGPG